MRRMSATLREPDNRPQPQSASVGASCSHTGILWNYPGGMRVRGFNTSRATPRSIDLVPIKRAQVLLDADLAEICKTIAARKGYASLTGLINDALIALLKDDPEFELEFAPEDVAAAMRASADRKQRRLDELGGWSQPAQVAAQDAAQPAQAKPPERRKAERRTKTGRAALWQDEGHVDRRKKGRDRRKG